MSGWIRASTGRECPVCGRKKHCCWSADLSIIDCTASVDVGELKQAPHGYKLWKPDAKGAGMLYRRVDADGAFVGGADAGDLERRRADQEKYTAMRIEQAKMVWSASTRATLRDGAERVVEYLAARGIDVSLLPGGELPLSVRYNPSTFAGKIKTNPDVKTSPSIAYSWPAMVACVVNGKGVPTGVHRTFLAIDGSARKRSDSTADKDDGCTFGFGAPKQMLGTCGGGAARLRREITDGTLIIAEGIETALACMVATGWTAWAALSATGIQSLEIDPEIFGVGKLSTVVIACDLDKRHTGLNAGQVLANRLKAAASHLDVRVCVPTAACAPSLVAVDAEGKMVPKVKGCDWLDVLNAHGADAVRAGLQAIVQAPEAPAAAPAAPKPALRDQYEGFGERGTRWKQLPESGVAGDIGNGLNVECKSMGKHERMWREDPDICPRHTADRARLVLERFFKPHADTAKCIGERFTLAYWVDASQWLSYTGTHYVPVRENEVAGHVLQVLREHVYPDKKGRRAEVALTSRNGEDVMAAIRTLVSVRGEGLPFWAPSQVDDRGVADFRTSVQVVNDDEGDGQPKAGDASVLVFDNGIMSINDFSKGIVELKPHTSRLITTSRVPFTLPVEKVRLAVKSDPRNEARGGTLVGDLCPNWIKFLGEVFGEDDEGMEAIGELQKWFGYCMTEANHHEKIMLMTGPPRSGKGTLTQALGHVVGAKSTATTSFTSLSDKNETYALLGRKVAILTDASVDPREMIRTVERLKTISGGDPVSVEGKFKDKMPFVYLPLKFTIISNSVPKLADTSQALAARMLAIPTRRSFVGREDSGLKHRLKQEAAGIMIWSLFGLRQLRIDGQFFQPAIGKPIIDQFTRLSSPMAAFLSDVCVESPRSEVAENVLFTLYRAWADDAGVGRPGKEKMLADLQANLPMIDRRVKELKNKAVGRVIIGVRPRVKGEEMHEAGTKIRSEAMTIHALEKGKLAEFPFAIPQFDEERGSEQASGNSRDDFGIR